ncbi:MAG: winged helix DNA-binding protein [Xanthobacteraceae bacterium]|nr:winged helix DNA-binding protein [Xanthobacteraceae bacterium]MCW5673505.1 winged helix DNA-binding protein [Xanthobacteraceae bacterium]
MANAKALKPKERDEANAADHLDLGELPSLSGYMLRRAQFAAFNDFLRFFDDLGVRPVQYAVLNVIDRNPGLKQSQVSEALGIKRANLVAILDALERRQLAKREAVATDRRSYALRLTDKGSALMQELRARSEAHEKRLAAVIGEDGRQQLLKLLHGVIEAVGPGSEGDED